jgi:regulator of nucleoside diphosphate kinase
MGATIEYRLDEGPVRRVTLVYPADADIEQAKVSILTPIGTALLGLSAGQTIDFVANDGREHRLSIVAAASAPASMASA